MPYLRVMLDRRLRNPRSLGGVPKTPADTNPTGFSPAPDLADRRLKQLHQRLIQPIVGLLIGIRCPYCLTDD